MNERWKEEAGGFVVVCVTVVFDYLRARAALVLVTPVFQE